MRKLVNAQIVDSISGGLMAPVFKNNNDGTRDVEKFEIFDNKTGKHVGFAKNYYEAIELDMKTNGMQPFGPPPPPPHGHHPWGPPPPPPYGHHSWGTPPL